jgi:hypothetical protein
MPNLRSLSLFANKFDPFRDWSNDLNRLMAASLTDMHLRNTPLYPSFRRLDTLTTLKIFHDNFNLHVDTLLDFLEGNRSLGSVELDIQFTRPSLRNSERRVPFGNQLQSLSVSSWLAVDINALVSKIAVQKGASLTVSPHDLTWDQQ